MRTDDLKIYPYSFLKDSRLQSKNPVELSEIKLVKLVKTDISSN